MKNVILITGRDTSVLVGTSQEIENRLIKVNSEPFLFIPNESAAKTLAEISDMEVKEEYSIPEIKSKIKHCKNPMELKELNRTLNRLYKERKNHESKISI